MPITAYCYPGCSTCNAAKKLMKENNILFEEIHIAQMPPTKEQLKKYIALSGLPLERFFNTSGQVYRSLNLKDKMKSMSEDEKLELLEGNGMLIKRPLIVSETKVIAGLKPEEILQLK